MNSHGQLTLIPGLREAPARLAQMRLAEAHVAAEEQVGLLEDALSLVNLLARDVAEGGPVYPVGVRDLSRKIAGDAAWCFQTISTIMVNTGARKPKMDETGAEADPDLTGAAASDAA